MKRHQAMSGPQRAGVDESPRGPAGAAAARERAAVELDRAAVRVGGRTIWSELSLRVAPGEFVALLGPNGAGKSTLLKVLLGGLPLSAGTARVLGAAPGEANRAIGYLPQRRALDAGTRLRAQDVVRLGLDGDRWGLPLPRGLPRLGGAPRARPPAARERVAEALGLVGAGGCARRAIGELSGGEQQRVLIAQALVRRPRLLLLDEPLDSLDLPNQGAVAALVGRICRQQGVATVLVAHDVNPLLPYLQRVVYLARGRAVEGPVGEVMTSATLSALYEVPVEVLRASDGRLVVVGQPEPPAHHHDRHALGAGVDVGDAG